TEVSCTLTHHATYFSLVFATSANVGRKNVEDFTVATFFCNQPHIFSFQSINANLNMYINA
ncbi:hypothetical protein P4575_27675, partial [Priestia megaterium]|uniref:hypothetical protein n=1 Tax=Priestia megaterium TaxID=1404 RepID=UPI002E2442C2|nr:hypothetical protein [Priestia megaterium]